jgi:putative CocE/NonD family hydrolase
MTDDQRFAARRPDVLVYETPVLTAPLTVTGPVVADLWISLDDKGAAGPNRLLDADFVVKLIDVLPDTLRGQANGVPLGGYQMLVRGEIFRGRYRNSYEKPEGFKRGEIYQVKFDLPDVAHTFLPGHKMMVQVQSSWSPLADRNPQQFVNIYEAKDTDFIPVEVKVWRDAGHASGVVLSVLKP